MLYPVAVHSRFEHSRGVYWLASEAIDRLKTSQQGNSTFPVKLLLVKPIEVRHPCDWLRHWWMKSMMKKSLMFQITLSGPVNDPAKLPKWNYDGSSTGQASGEDSELVSQFQLTKRHSAAKIFSHPDVVAEEPWYKNMGEDYKLIAAITPNTTNWTAKVVVLEKTSARTAYHSPTKYQNVVLMDMEGSQSQQNLTAHSASMPQLN
ncbi:Glutamine synthetase [Forsythia ovata]|uniref:Glutamine synthetase n=1 Tax=Forsythia ovata TaxID=205694 RepID=A0ABD1SMX3_9LAMI